MDDFTPTLYVKSGCPHCFKVRVFLLDAGLQDQVALREFTPGTPAEDALKSELAPHFEKVTFPSAQVEPGNYMNESDDIIDWFAGKYGVNKDGLATFRAYAEGPYNRIRQLFKEVRELKEKMA